MGRRGRKNREISRHFLDAIQSHGASDARRAVEYAQAFYAYEDWLHLGRPEGRLEVAALPLEYHFLIERWPEAFEFFRHSMFAYLSYALGMRPFDSVLRSLWRRTAIRDPSGAAAVLERAWNAYEPYRTQRTNAWSELLDVVNGSNEDATKVRAYMRAYVVAFEMDLPLWFLGVVGRGFARGRYDAESFGGPETRTNQGALVDQVVQALQGTALAPYFDNAYDPALRNAASHNDYEVADGPSGPVLTQRSSGKAWTAEVLVGKVHAVWALVHAVEHAVQVLHHSEASRGDPVRTDFGVLSTMSAVQDDHPLVIVSQLWCFRDLDPEGDWLERAVVSLSAEADGQQRLSFSPSAFSIGDPLDPAVVSSMRSVGWVRVVRVPIAPDLGIGHPAYEVPSAGPSRYEIVGPPDQHIVPVGAVLEEASSP